MSYIHWVTQQLPSRTEWRVGWTRVVNGAVCLVTLLAASCFQSFGVPPDEVCPSGEECIEPPGDGDADVDGDGVPCDSTCADGLECNDAGECVCAPSICTGCCSADMDECLDRCALGAHCQSGVCTPNCASPCSRWLQLDSDGGCICSEMSCAGICRADGSECLRDCPAGSSAVDGSCLPDCSTAEDCVALGLESCEVGHCRGSCASGAECEYGERICFDGWVHRCVRKQQGCLSLVREAECFEPCSGAACGRWVETCDAGDRDCTAFYRNTTSTSGCELPRGFAAAAIGDIDGLYGEALVVISNTPGASPDAHIDIYDPETCFERYDMPDRTGTLMLRTLVLADLALADGIDDIVVGGTYYHGGDLEDPNAFIAVLYPIHDPISGAVSLGGPVVIDWDTRCVSSLEISVGRQGRYVRGDNGSAEGFCLLAGVAGEEASRARCAEVL